MLVTAFSPLGHGQSYEALGYKDKVALKEKIVTDIAQSHGVTPAQVMFINRYLTILLYKKYHTLKVILRWGVQRGCAVIPKSENEERIRENIDINSFQLTDDEMKSMKSLECGLRMNDPAVFCPKFFNTECPIWD